MCRQHDEYAELGLAQDVMSYPIAFPAIQGWQVHVRCMVCMDGSYGYVIR